MSCVSGAWSFYQIISLYIREYFEAEGIEYSFEIQTFREGDKIQKNVGNGQQNFDVS